MIWNNGLLTDCGQVTPYGNIDLGQHWFMQWLVVWQHFCLGNLLGDGFVESSTIIKSTP